MAIERECDPALLSCNRPHSSEQSHAPAFRLQLRSSRLSHQANKAVRRQAVTRLAITFVVCSCLCTGTAGAQNPSYLPDADWKAPAGAAAKQNPLANKPQAAQGG